MTFNWLDHPVYKMILVANRDEFFDRPSKPIHYWDSGIYAGKDLRGGGTWLGIHPDGRFAAITNYRDINNIRKDAITRGNLVKDFLEGDDDPYTYLEHVFANMHQYDGFNLLVAKDDRMYYLSNYGKEIVKVNPGFHTLSNILMNSDWPKEKLGLTQLEENIASDRLKPDDLLALLKSDIILPDHLLPDTGATLEQERALSAQFVRLADYYGTVNTTALLWGHDGTVTLKERTYTLAESTEDNLINFIMNSVNQEL
ncbi:NRDE family protein [Anditalea andensis]|nr:NRDE family protein [Anditalea andensis]